MERLNLDGDKKIISIVESEKSAPDKALISFLEEVLQEAKNGTIKHICVVSMQDKSAKLDYMARFYKQCKITKWSDALAFTEILNQEIIRVRETIEERFRD